MFLQLDSVITPSVSNGKEGCKIEHVFEIPNIMIASLGSQSLLLELDIRNLDLYRVSGGDSYEHEQKFHFRLMIDKILQRF